MSMKKERRLFSNLNSMQPFSGSEIERKLKRTQKY